MDFEQYPVAEDPRLWFEDHLHGNELGHQTVAAALAWRLGIDGFEGWAEALEGEQVRPQGREKLIGDGEPRPISSADVNDYIRDATGGDFTAKHFRTWGASVIFFEQLLASAEGERQTLKTVLEPVAEALGNTPTMSRKSYVHPCLIEALAEDARDPLNGMKRPRARRHLSSAETAFLNYLKKKPKRARRRKAAG